MIDHPRRDGLGTSGAGHAHDVGKQLNPARINGLAIFLLLISVVIGNCPGGALKQTFAGGVPPRLRGSRHRVPTDIARFHATLADLCIHLPLHTHDIADAAAGGVFRDLIQHRAYRKHGHRDDDQCVFFFRSTQHLRQIIGDVIAFRDRFARAGRRAVIAESSIASCD